MTEFIPTSEHYHSCDGVASTYRRSLYPLHYHLECNDVMAFRRELRSGASPLVVDDEGVSVIEILIEKIETIVARDLCTSFAIDGFLSTLRNEALYPAKFATADWRETIQGLYFEHEYELYSTFRNESRRGGSRDDFACGDFGARAAAEPLHAFYHNPRRKKPFIPKYNVYHDQMPVAAKKVLDDCRESGREPQLSEETACLISVEDHINRPASYKVETRMFNELRQLRVFVDLLRELATCDVLVRNFEQKRSDELLALNANASTTGQSGRGPKENRSLWFRDVCMPYQFTTALTLLFSLYPAAPDGKLWNAKDPLDGRSLVGLVCKLNLPGASLLRFISEAAAALALLLRVLPAPAYFPSKPAAEHLLHMAFVLDVPALFCYLMEHVHKEALPTRQATAHKHRSVTGSAQNTGSAFNWTKTQDEMELQNPSHALNLYLIALQNPGKKVIYQNDALLPAGSCGAARRGAMFGGVYAAGPGESMMAPLAGRFGAGQITESLEALARSFAMPRPSGQNPLRVQVSGSGRNFVEAQPCGTAL